MQQSTKRKLLALILFVVILAFTWKVYMHFARALRGSYDVNDWITWLHALRTYGLYAAYRHTWSMNYPPIFVAVLWVYQKYVTVTGTIFTPNSSFLGKLPSVYLNFSTLVIAGYFMLRRNAKLWAWISFLFLALNPALLLDGPIWGQIDLSYSALLAVALLLACESPLWAGVVYALAILIKFQSISAAPVLGIYALHKLVIRRDVRYFSKIALGAVVPILAVFAWFALHGELTPMVKHAFVNTVGQYRWLTMHAFNIWYLVGVSPTTDDQTRILGFLTYRTIGLGMLTLSVIYACYYVIRMHNNQPASLLKASVIVTTSFFLYPTEMHERYIIPSVVLAIFAMMYDKKWTIIALGLTATTFVNLAAVWQYRWMLTSFSVGVSLVNVLLMVIAYVLTILDLRANKSPGVFRRLVPSVPNEQH